MQLCHINHIIQEGAISYWKTAARNSRFHSYKQVYCKSFFCKQCQTEIFRGKILAPSPIYHSWLFELRTNLDFSNACTTSFDLDRHLSQMVNFRLIPIYTYSCMKCPNFESYNKIYRIFWIKCPHTILQTFRFPDKIFFLWVWMQVYNKACHQFKFLENKSQTLRYNKIEIGAWEACLKWPT